MAKKLYEAATIGSVSSLLESLNEDAAILDRIAASFVTETPLHVAALRGHLLFARELLRRKPDLAREPNSQGLSPLHLASAKGDVEMVKELLPFVSDISLDRDHEGRTPLHAAAIKGRVNVLRELIQVKPESVSDLTGRGETVLHLSVRYGQLDVLKMLVGSVEYDDDFINQKDGNGSTILHLSASMKQIHIMKYLLSETRVEVNEKNGYGLTALDLLALCPSESGEMQMSPSPPESDMQAVVLDDLRAAYMVVAILIAAVTFQAGLTPPGGVWQDDSITNSTNITSNAGGNHTAGISILDDKNPPASASFFYFNSLAFTASMGVIGSCIGLGPFPWSLQRRLPIGPSVWTLVLKTSLFLALFSVQVAYYTGSNQLRNSTGSFLGVMLAWITAGIAPVAVAVASRLIACLKKVGGEGPPPNDESPPGDVEMEASQTSCITSGSQLRAILTMGMC